MRNTFLRAMAAIIVFTCIYGCSSRSTSPSGADGSLPATQPDTLGAYQQTGDTAPARDPSIMRQGDTYYEFSSDPYPPAGGYLPIRCSSDKISWNACGYVFKSMPAWITAAVPAAYNLWAPDISFFNGAYHLYYAATQTNTESSVIGEVTNATLDPASPLYQWVDQGEVIASHPGDGFNVIDPSILVDRDGSIWLSYGSYWSGIKQLSIDPSTGKQSAADQTIYSLASQPAEPNGALEGSSMVKHGSYYYLFASKGLCCQSDTTQDTYEQIVGRSTSPHGPFLDEEGVDMMVGGGTMLLEKNASWNAPGGGTAHMDAATGESLLVFHAARKGADPTAYLWAKQIHWVNDWPVLAPIQ